MEVHYDRVGTTTVHLPHQVLLRELGSELKYLAIDSGPKFDEELNPDKDPRVETFEDALHPRCLEQILGACPSLEILTITNVDFFDISDNVNVVNDSITALNIEYTIFWPEGLTQIKACLPSFRDFTMLHCELVNMNVIHLPNNMLNNFTWKKPQEPLAGKALFHISDKVGDVYKVVDEQGMTSCTKKEFDTTTTPRSVVGLRLYIQCEYLRTLTANYKNFSYTGAVHGLYSIHKKSRKSNKQQNAFMVY